MQEHDWKQMVRGRIEHDEALISEAIFDGRPLGAIFEVRAARNREDEHRPCFVECEAGRFLYKPRDVRFEDAFGKLAAALFPGEVRIPRYVACDGYGYAEFIEFDAMPVVTDKPNVLSYRTGKIHALFHALGHIDIGRGNIGVCGSTPVLIDVEICLDPKHYPLDAVQQRLELLACESETLREVLDSPFRGAAGMLAFAGVPRCNLVYSLLPCKSAQVLDGDGDGDGAAAAAQRLPLGFESYVRGYLEGWDVCLAHRAQLEDFVRGCADWTVRVVLPWGSPFQHAVAERLQLAPDQGMQDALPDEVGEAVLAKIKEDAVRQASWQRGPIYRVQVDSRTLYDVRAGKEYPGFFAASALDNTLAHLARAHAGQARFITSLLRDMFLKADT